MKQVTEKLNTAADGGDLRFDAASVAPRQFDARARWVAAVAAHPDAAAVLLLLVVSLAYASLFFGKVQQVDIDVGNDFTTADLLFRGRLLYNDVSYPYGPLAPWLHLLLFRLFGVSLRVILAAGSVAALSIVLLAYLLARRILPLLPSLTAALIVLVNATYGPHLMCYAVPYVFPATYGLLFSLLSMYSASRALERGFSRWDLLIGALAGLALVTKHEFAVISLFILLAQLVFRRRQRLAGLERAALASFASCGALVAAFAVPLLRQTTLTRLLNVVYPRQYLLATHYFNDQTHFWGSRAWMGVRVSLESFLLNLGFVLAAGFLLALLLGLARGEHPKKVALLLTAAGLPLLWRREYLGSYPLLLHGTVLGFALADRNLHGRRKVIFLTIGAAAFLFRILPAPDVGHDLFGLLYFVPSLIVYVYFCHSIVAPRLARFFPEQRMQIAVVAVFLFCFALYPFARTYYPWSRRTVPILSERGVLRVEAREAPKVKLILEEIQRRTSPGDTILMLPHGAFYYFLSGRQPPSRHVFYSPGEITDGPAEIAEVQRLSQAPPKLIILDDVALWMFFPGPRNHFGEAYNTLLGRWIQENYRAVQTTEYYNRPVRFLVPRVAAGGSS